jgi:hypothetical protein
MTASQTCFLNAMNQSVLGLDGKHMEVPHQRLFRGNGPRASVRNRGPIRPGTLKY